MIKKSEPRDSDQLEESIVKLFKEAFEINIKTCTEEEWAEKITINGGALKQWQSLTKIREDNQFKKRTSNDIHARCDYSRL